MDLAEQRTYCTYCPRLCRHECPVAEAERTEVATPTFKQQVALLAATGERPLDAERAAVLYKCSDCHATVDACRHRIDVADSLREGRYQAVRQGVAPPQAERVAERFREHGSPYSQDLRARVGAAVPGGLARVGQVAVLPSCTTATNAPELLDRAVSALRRAGVDAHAALPEPPCCGYPLEALGHRDAFRLHAARVVESLAGFDTVALEGPACADTLATRYRAVGVTPRFKVLPLVDLLSERLPGSPAAGEARAERASTTYAYHDPCFLGRRLRRHAEPRAVVRALTGGEPVDLPSAREGTTCSGGGGGYPATNPKGAVSCAARVVDEFRATKADVLVTGCPSARRLIARAAPDVRVTDLLGLL